MTKACCTAVLVLGVLVWAPNAQAQTKKVSFAIHELGPLTTGQTSWVKDINEFGQVVGYVFDGTLRHACIWEQVGEQWIVRDLGSSEYYNNAYANSINELGQVVGHTILDDPQEAFFYDDRTGTFESLPKLEGFNKPSTGSINNLGVICGFSRGGDLGLATLWERSNDGTWTVVNLAEMFESVKASSLAADINDNLQIVGYSEDTVNDLSSRVAHLWERNITGEWTITNLCDTEPSSASAINSLGQIAGDRTTNGNRHAGIWKCVEGEWLFTDLSVLVSGVSSSNANDINNLGQVLINADLLSGANTQYLYKNGDMYNLDKCLPEGSGWSLATGNEINDQGQIVGFGYDSAGDTLAYVMDTKQATYSYTSTGSAVAIKDKSTASKAMTLTDNVTITDLNVKVTLYHTRYADLQFDLVGPDNVTRRLCNAGAVTGSGTKTLVFDDEGATGSIRPVYWLSNYDGKSTQGKWTLKISDTVKNSKTGSFTSFTLDVVPAL